MKRNFQKTGWVVMAGLAVMLTSCKKFIKEELITTLTEDYYKTDVGLEDLVKSAYAPLQWLAFQRFHPRVQPPFRPSRSCWTVTQARSVAALSIRTWAMARTLRLSRSGLPNRGSPDRESP